MTISIRSFAAAFRSSILLHGSHIEPVRSSIKEISRLSPLLLLPPAPTVHAELGQRAAVAVVTTLMQAWKLPWQTAGAPASESLGLRAFKMPRNGVLTQDVAVTLNSVLSALGENSSELFTTLLGLAVAK